MQLLASGGACPRRVARTAGIKPAARFHAAALEMEKIGQTGNLKAAPAALAALRQVLERLKPVLLAAAK
ncbi:MAG: hypothetical protein JNM56_10890 [Planctomycetia bacterium]|nr:hypothetical protein [Planctomycetia bacterium]